ISTKNGFPIKFKDVGRVEESGADATNTLSLDGSPAVAVGIRKQTGANTVALIRNVKQRMAEIIPTLPKDFKIAVIRDQSEFIENSLHAIEEHLVLGAIFAAIVVFLFLWNFRSTIIAALAIPTSIIAAFALIAALGYSLNQMTMLALTLMVGIVIDDAIVVLENIYRFVEEKGMDPYLAAVEGTKEIGLAVLATTLSLLAVFIPVGFMTGIVGRFMSSFGLTSAAAIAVSLIVSFTLTPMLAARWIKRPEHKKRVPDVYEPSSDLDYEDGNEAHAAIHRHDDEEEESSSKNGWFYSKVDGSYTWLLRIAMRHRWAVVLICAITVASIVPLYKFVGMAFLPDEDESIFQINVRGPQGTSLAATQSILDRIARDVREKMPGLRNTVVNAGGFGGGSGGNAGNVSISLVPVGERKQGQTELIAFARQLVKPYVTDDWKINVAASSSIAQGIGLGRGGSGIGYYISGPDMNKLNDYANQLVDKMKNDPTFREPDNSVDVGTPEVQFIIDRVKAADLGVQATDISRALNIAAAGQRVSTFSVGTNQYDVVVQADEKFRRTRQNLQYFTVASSKGM
ncbi:MAG TPA: efflux RND transporter permease subunit, partial [Pyrinomonadaceae bacterium]|nr:efflux RND transporter permease subunit [Pyrinomonadaceae bacterium]